MKILILTGKFGLGHFSAATTLAEQIKETHPEAEILVKDIYEIAYPEYCDMFYRSYMKFLSRGCKIYNFAYKKAVHGKKGFKQHLQLGGNHMSVCLANVIDSFNPNVIISTYSLCARLVSDYKRGTGSNVPLVTCITDVSIHNVWLNKYTDMYLVGTESTKDSLIKQGVPENMIFISGIPVKSMFCYVEQKNSEQHAVKELLIMGGGLGLLPNCPQFYQRLNGLTDVHTTIIVGKNEKLHKKLSGKYHNISVIGYTEHVDDYMRRADLLITKPGGITTFEAIHCQLPMLIFQPFLEQEIKNGEFIVDNGFGVILNGKTEDSVDEIEDIINNQKMLSCIRANMREFCGDLDKNALSRYLHNVCKARLNDERIA